MTTHPSGRDSHGRAEAEIARYVEFLRQPIPRDSIQLKQMVQRVNQGDTLGLNWAALPKLSFIQMCAWSFPSRQRYINEVASDLCRGSFTLGRSLREDERDALAMIGARRYVTESWAPVCSIIGATFSEYRTRAQNRFPLWTPDPNMHSTDFFPSKARPWFTGDFAQRMWRASRFVAYFPLWAIGMRQLFASMANMGALVRLGQDPRLQDLRQAILAAEPAGGRAIMYTQREDSSISGPHEREPSYASPDGFAEESTSQAKMQTRQSTSAPSLGPFGIQGRQAPPQDRREPSQVAEANSYSTFDDRDSGLFDDAPFAFSAAQQQERKGPSSKPKPVASWEEIRQRAQTQDAAKWQKQQQKSEMESGAYFSADEDKVYAKAQAQKEFDAMLERERRGSEGGRW